MRFQELRIVEECEPLNNLTQSYQSATAGRFKWTGENRRTVCLRFRGREDKHSMSLKTVVISMVKCMSDDLFVVSLRAAASESLVLF